MKNRYLFLLLLMTNTLLAQTITSVTPLSMDAPLYDKFELAISINASFSNGYDYDQIVVRAQFTAPSGRKDTVEGFYMQDFDLNTTTGFVTTKGSAAFRVRFAPNEMGNWAYSVVVSTVAGTSAATTGTFRCISSSNKGFVRKDKGNFLKFDSGDSYIPIGQNLCWQRSNPYLDFDNWLGKMGAAKANFMRLWLCHWGVGLEWKSGTGGGYEGLKKYKQNNAFYIDKIVEKCREQDMYMMLCINHHGQISTQVNTNWNENPYNTANGGPCNTTADFFSSTAAKSLHKNRLRYIVARWGYSRHIMSWELFNEVSWTDNYNTAGVKTAVRDWHIEMADYLKRLDPNRHLVTTSFGSLEDDALWQSPSMDFTQTHHYTNNAYIEQTIAQNDAKMVQTFQKPHFCGEFSISGSGGEVAAASDPKGIHLHNTLWATVFSSGMGAGATWWWDSYTDPQNLYNQFTPLSIFTQKWASNSDNFKPIAPVTNVPTNLNAYILKSENSKKAVGWLHHKKYNWKDIPQTGTPTALAGATVTLNNMVVGSYILSFYNCTTGQVTSTTTVNSNSTTFTFTIPAFTWDWAFTAYHADVVKTPEIVVKDLKISPNPIQKGDILTVNLKDIVSENAWVEAYLLNGQTVFSEKIGIVGERLDIDTMRFPKGYLVLKIRVNNELWMGRLVVQ
jgi:hypothetical protein